MIAIFKREVLSYFFSPIAYVLIGFYILVSSVMFYASNITQGISEINATLGNMSIVLVFIIPILTMRLLSEDRKNGTEVLLISSPTSITSIVLGKFFASFFVFLVMNIISIVYPIILYIYGTPTSPQLFGGYIGFLLLGGAFIAIGVFASSLSESQIIAAIVSFVISLSMLFMEGIAGIFGGLVAQILNWVSLLTRFSGFSQGIISLSAIVYYISFIAIFIFLTIQLIEKRRWSQG